jgi:hypothetical protein
MVVIISSSSGVYRIIEIKSIQNTRFIDKHTSLNVYLIKCIHSPTASFTQPFDEYDTLYKTDNLKN